VGDWALIQRSLGPVVTCAVAHYTRLGTLPHIIGTGGIVSAWATPAQFLNDRRELALGLEVLVEVANRKPRSGGLVRGILDGLQAGAGGLATDAFQMSFSGDPDELGQWRGYADNGMGCAVVTDALAVKRLADVAGWVIYNGRQQRGFAGKVLEGLRGTKDQLQIEQTLVAAACYMKHEGFLAEREFRLVRFAHRAQVEFRETRGRVVPYIDLLAGPVAASLPVARVIIGPGWQLAGLPAQDLFRNHVVLGVRRLLEGRGLDPDHLVGVSRIPYDPR